MLTPEQKRVGVRLAVLLTPLVMVKAAAMLLAAPGPRSAAATPAPAQNASAAASLTTSPPTEGKGGPDGCQEEEG